MFNFDEDRYIRIQSGAVGLLPKLSETVKSLLADGAKNIHFLGTGGAAILMGPAVQLLRQYSMFPVYAGYTAEIMLTKPKTLGKGSIVVIPSLSGTTMESVALLDFVRSQGATVITLVGHVDTPLGQGGDHVFVNFAEDDTSCESFYVQSLGIVLAVLDQRGELAGVDEILTDFSKLPQALLAVKRQFEVRGKALAEEIKDTTYHIITGGGAVWTEAFYYGMCILEEMQWVRTRPVHASDFFHGTLELVEKDVSVIVLLGEDDNRPLGERVVSFAKQYTDQVTVLDAAEFELPGIGVAARKLISPATLSAALERHSAHLEHKRDHPLTTRRYYKRVPY